MKTAAELNRVIAEWCGWKAAFPEGYLEWDGQGYSRKPVEPPDYCSDLNAIHEAENNLSIGQLIGFDRHLYEQFPVNQIQHCIHATARQRAEALVKVIEQQ